MARKRKGKQARGFIGFLHDKDILVPPRVRKKKVNFATKAQKARIKRIKAAQKKKDPFDFLG